MAKFRTHYDNLQVARSASPEVYRSLSLKYHPDRNGGDATFAEIMRIINASYGVLSDPAKRQAHDSWIQQKEERSAPAEPLLDPAPAHSASRGTTARKT